MSETATLHWGVNFQKADC